jgi:integrase
MGVFKRWVKNNDGSKTPVWYIRYTANGKEKWESVGKVGVVTKDVARARLEERRRLVRLGQIDMIGTKVPTLQEFSVKYLAHINDVKQNRSAKRTKQALEHFIVFFGSNKLSEINPEDVDTYKSRRLNQGAKPATINRELAVIKHLFNIARKWHKFFGDNPVSQSGLLEVHNSVERTLTPEEEQRLLAVSPKYLQDIILIALNTGMRQGEILSLRWEWIDLANSLITLPQTYRRPPCEFYNNFLELNWFCFFTARYI